MGAKGTYHLVAEGNRESMDSNAGEDQQLLATSITEDEDPPKKCFTFSFHPTFWTRLVAFVLLIPSAVFLVPLPTVACGVIIIIAVVRNLLVLFYHLLSKCVRVRIELVGNARRTFARSPANAKWFTERWAQVGIDLVIWIVLLIVVTVVGTSKWRYCNYLNCWSGKFLTGFILAWVAMPFYFVSIIDGGRPSSFTITSTVVCDVAFRYNFLSQLIGGREDGVESPVMV